MAFLGYFAGFDLTRRDADGVLIPLANETLNVREPGGSMAETVTSDAYGFVAGAHFTSLTANIDVEFYHDTYPGVLAQTTAVTLEEAFSLATNFVIEDLYAAESEVIRVDVYIEDPDDAVYPQLILSGAPGDIPKAPYFTATGKAIDLHTISYTADGRQSDYSFETTNVVNESVTAPIPEGAGMAIGNPIAGSPHTGGLLFVDGGDVLGSTPPASPLQSWRRNAVNTAIEAYTPASGTVTSVNVTAPSFLSVSGAPITGAGTIAISLANQSANQIFAGPGSGGAAAPTFRSLVAADIPNLDANKITAGTMATARLGSGTTSSATALYGDQTYKNPLTVGAAIASGTNDRLFYQSGGNLAQSASLRFDGTTLNVGNDTTGVSAGVLVKSGASYPLLLRNAGGSFLGYLNSAGDMEIAGNLTVDGGNLYGISDLRANYLQNTGANKTYIQTSVSGEGFAFLQRNATDIPITISAHASQSVNLFEARGLSSKTSYFDKDANLGIADARNLIFGTSTGTKIGTGSTQKIGFFGATPVTQRAAITSITDLSGGGVSNTVNSVSPTFDASEFDDIHATLVDRINKLRQLVQDLGLSA